MVLLRVIILTILLSINWILAFDFNILNEDSNGIELKVFSDDTVNFFNELSSAVLIDLDDKTGSLFNSWDVKQFYEKNIFSAFTFSNFYENNNFVKKTNLKHFTQSVLDEILNQKEKRFHLAFSMPSFMKKNIFLPNILNCKKLEDQFNELKMTIYVNYQNYNEKLSSNLDQVICVVKGDMNIITLKEEENSEESAEKITYFSSKILPGKCAYIPKTWIYSLKTDYAWTYRISWESLNERLDECDSSTGNGTLVLYKFKSENNEDFDLTYGLMVYFYIWLGENLSEILTYKSFLERFKADNTLFKNVPYDQSFAEIAFELFELLDINDDDKISIEDLDTLNEDTGKIAMTQAVKSFESLKNLLSEKAESKSKALNDMLLKLQKMYNSGEISEEILIDKLSEAIEKMPGDSKMKLKEQNINLLQFIMNFIKNKKTEDEKENAENTEREKRKKKPVDKNQKEEDESPKSYVTIGNDDIIEDIEADESLSTDRNDREEL